MSTHDLDWQRVNQRIYRLEALADEVRAWCQATDFKDLWDARHRLRRALQELDRAASPKAELCRAPVEVMPPEVPMQAELSRRKRVYETLLRTARNFSDIGEGSG